MPSLLPVSAEEIRAFRQAVTYYNPGVGIVDLRTGRVYLVVASQFVGGDHMGLAEQALGIDDFENAPHLRGFVLGIEDGKLFLAGVSGLNPDNNKMEPQIFEELKAVLMSQIDFESMEEP